MGKRPAGHSWQAFERVVKSSGTTWWTGTAAGNNPQEVQKEGYMLRLLRSTAEHNARRVPRGTAWILCISYCLCVLLLLNGL